MTYTSQTISLQAPGPAEKMIREVWDTGIPGLAFQNDSLLYSIYSIAAMHLAKMEPQNVEAMEASSTYFGPTIRLHRDEVAQLNKANADIACLTSTLIRVRAFAILQDRN